MGLLLPKLLFQPIDAPPQFIHLPLPGEAQVLQQVIEVSLHLAFGLFFQLGVLPTQAGENVIDQGAGLVWIEASTADPGLGDAPQALGHKGGGAKASEEQLLKGPAGIHEPAGVR